MIPHIDFLNKNTLRRYPLKDSSECVTVSGKEIPLSLFSACRISTKVGNTRVYIKYVCVSGNNISVLVSDYTGDVDTVLGAFKVAVNSDFQSVQMTSFVPYASGFLTLGPRTSLAAFSGGDFVSFANGELEGSCVVPHPIPTLQYISDGTSQVTGRLSTSLSQVTKEIVSDTISLAATNRNLIMSTSDIASKYNNCPLKVIKRINSVEPDANGAIDLYGVSPVTITLGESSFSISSSIAKEDVCNKTKVNIPPVDVVDTYHGDILAATHAEWETWPQYAPPQ